jgi:hypothetical protein
MLQLVHICTRFGLFEAGIARFVDVGCYGRDSRTGHLACLLADDRTIERVTRTRVVGSCVGSGSPAR